MGLSLVPAGIVGGGGVNDQHSLKAECHKFKILDPCIREVESSIDTMSSKWTVQVCLSIA